MTKLSSVIRRSENPRQNKKGSNVLVGLDLRFQAKKDSYTLGNKTHGWRWRMKVTPGGWTGAQRPGLRRSPPGWVSVKQRAGREGLNEIIS